MVFRWPFSVLSNIWEETQNSSHAALPRKGGRQMVRSSWGLFHDAKGSVKRWTTVNNRRVNVADYKRKEYQAAKIHKNETKVELGESPDFWWLICYQGGLYLLDPAALGKAFLNYTPSIVIFIEKDKEVAPPYSALKKSLSPIHV